MPALISFIVLSPVLVRLNYPHSCFGTSCFASSSSSIAFIGAWPFTIGSSCFEAGTSYLPSSAASATFVAIAIEGLPLEVGLAELELEAASCHLPGD
jgi:hypothetical protein